MPIGYVPADFIFNNIADTLKNWTVLFMALFILIKVAHCSYRIFESRDILKLWYLNVIIFGATATLVFFAVMEEFFI